MSLLQESSKFVETTYGASSAFLLDNDFEQGC